MQETKKCPKCQGEMEKGILSSRMGAFASLWWATNVKLAGLWAGERRETVTYKCNNCGYLESYIRQ